MTPPVGTKSTVKKIFNTMFSDIVPDIHKSVGLANDPLAYVKEANIGDVDCDGKTDYAVKQQLLEGKFQWQARLSSSPLLGEPKMVSDGNDIYREGDRVSFALNGEAMEGEIVSFRVKLENKDILLSHDGASAFGFSSVIATVKTADGDLHDIATSDPNFQRIVTPEELPAVKE